MYRQINDVVLFRLKLVQNHFVTSSVWWIVHRNTKVTLHIRRTFVQMSASPRVWAAVENQLITIPLLVRLNWALMQIFTFELKCYTPAQGNQVCNTRGEKRKMPPLKKKEFNCIKAALNSVLPCCMHMSLCNCCMLTIHIYPVFVYKGEFYSQV